MKSQHREKNIVKLAEKIPASIPGDKNLLCKVTHRRSWLQSRGKGRAGQNYPEGTAVALPLIKDGMGKKKAFLIGSMSAIVEPIFGVLAAVVTTFITSFMPLLLAFAAGTMIYVVVQELLPEAQGCEGDKTATLGFIAGFLIMMILDVSLG